MFQATKVLYESPPPPPPPRTNSEDGILSGSVRVCGRSNTGVVSRRTAGWRHKQTPTPLTATACGTNR